jgi:hypothetical protein
LNINILGEEYKIIEEKLIDMDGLCDSSTKTIKIDEDLNRIPDEGTKQDLKQYKRKVLRHEIIHAIMEECGLSIYDDMANERFVDWIAIMYPKIKNIFKNLDIES